MSRGRTRTAASPPRWPTCPISPTTSTTPEACPSTRSSSVAATSDREPLIRAITDVAEGVYDGLTLGAEATFAAEGVEGQLRYDPMSMRPFMSYPEGRLRRALAEDHRLRSAETDLRARQLVPARPRGRPLPLARISRQPARRCCGCIRLKQRRGQRAAHAGRHPPDPGRAQPGRRRRSRPRTSTRLLSIDAERWRREMAHREQHLAQFDGLPNEIWAAHRRIAAVLEQGAD